MAKGTFSRSASQKSKFEEALSAVEQGLAFKFDQLLQEWPSDLPSAKRALSTTLVHLSADRVPSIQVAPHEAMDKESARLTFLCNAALALVNGVLDKMGSMREDHVRELFGVLRLHYSDLMAWLVFLAQDYLMAPTEGPNPRVGSRSAANILKRLLEKDKIKYLKDDMGAMGEFVELVLAVWVCSVPDDEGPDIDTESYARFVHPMFDMLWNCLIYEPAKGIALEKVAGYNHKHHKSLAHSLSYRCVQWARIYADDDDPLDNCKVFIGTALISQIFANAVPAFAKALIKSDFPSLVLEAAMDFPLESTHPDVVALPVQIGQLMLAFQPSNAYELRKVIPEIFEAGLLKVIVHQLLSPHATLEKPFPDWLGRDPLLKISSLCLIPEISYALSWALSDGTLSEETLEDLWTDPVARKRWRPFLRATGAYQKAFEQQLEEDSDGEVYDEDCIETIALCDNTDHTKTDGRHMLLVDAVECSWCHVTVYCSEECQRHDWKKLHKEECSRDRVYRIDRQLNGAWISHRNRMLLFRVYELFLQKAIPVIAALPRLDTTAHSPAGKAALFMDHSTLPLSMRLFDMAIFKSLSHDSEPMFGDKRSMALIGQYEEDETDTIRLTGGIAPLGQYLVVVLGSFVIEPEVDSDSSDSEDSGGTSEEEEDEDEEKLPRLTLKNGYIRVLEVVNPDKACEMEVHRGITGITTLSFEPPDESDAYDSDSDFRRIE